MCYYVNGLVCCVFDSVCKLFDERIRNMFGCCCYFVVECYRKCLVWVTGLCWIYCVLYSKECECCICDPIVHQSVPSIGFVYVFVCRKLSPHLRVWELVFALLILILCVMLHTMWSCICYTSCHLVCCACTNKYIYIT